MTTHDVLSVVADYLNGNIHAAIPLSDMFESAGFTELASGLRGQKKIALFHYKGELGSLRDVEDKKDEIETGIEASVFRTKLEAMAAQIELHSHISDIETGFTEEEVVETVYGQFLAVYGEEGDE
jgi:hypothetical protein